MKKVCRSERIKCCLPEDKKNMNLQLKILLYEQRNELKN